MQKINANDFELFIFDCDGVIWEMDQAIEGSIEALNKLSDIGKKVYFYTNNATKSRIQYVQKLNKLGYNKVTTDQVITSAYVTANYIKDNFPEIKKIFVIGQEGLMEELQLCGFETLNGDFLNDVYFNTCNEFFQIKPDYSYQAVVMGLDTKASYAKSIYASFLIQKGAKFFVTNPDPSLIVGDLKIPGCWSASAQVVYGMSNIAEPTVLGKPNKAAVEQLLKQFQDIQRNQVLVIGDRMETDIRLATNAGVKSLLVETGAHKRTDLHKFPEWQPDYVLEKLGDIFKEV